MHEAIIVSAARTPIAKEAGALKDIPPEILGGLVIKEAVARSGLKQDQIEQIDDVIFGNCGSAVGCMARMALLKAGLPTSISGLSVDRQCCSGAQAIGLAGVYIQAGVGDLYVAGGVESMTRLPYMMDRPSQAFQRTAPPWYMARPLAPPEIGDPPMGITAENVAERFKVSREDQDEFSYLSQVKAARALKEGRFEEQIVPVVIPQRKGEPIVFDTDEHPRAKLLEALARLQPAFKPGGTVTAGNSSGINDGAGAVVVASREKAEAFGLTPMAKVIAHAAAGVDPNIMGIGPVPATRKLLAKTGMSLDKIDVIELNEAFASQAVYCCRELAIDWKGRDQERINPNGGAIALGHPIAGSLAILTIKAMYELKRRNGRYGLITACGGGGQGIAMIIENI